MVKQIVFAELARIGMALASPKRLELIDLLCQVEYSVEDLSAAVGASVAATSHHLQVLKRARLVSTKQEGHRIFYRVNAKVPELWKSLSVAGNENLAEIGAVMSAFLRDETSFTGVSARVLLRKVRAGEVLLLDVRPVEEYESGHFPGAISMPVEELGTKLNTLPKGKEILAYCRGPYCLLSHSAVEQLRSKGFRAKRWLSGPPEWITDGIHIERSLGPPGNRTAPVRLRTNRSATKRR